MNDKNFDGMKSAVELLQGLDEATRNRLIQQISSKDNNLAKQLSNRVSDFDQLATISNQSIRILLQKVPLGIWAIAFRDASDKVKQHVLSNLPERQAESLEAKTLEIGPQKKSNVQKIQTEILSVARSLNFIR